MSVRTVSSKPSSHQDKPSDLVNKLSAAIQAGEKGRAEELVSELANMKLKLDISLQQEENEQRCKEHEFGVKVHVVDRESKGCIINLMVKACDTINDLKRKMMLKHDFPMDVQRWIIGKGIHRGREKLSQCGVTGAGHTLYLYLVTARTIELSREQCNTQKQTMHSSTDQMPWPPPASLDDHMNDYLQNANATGIASIGSVSNSASNSQIQNRQISVNSGSSLYIQTQLDTPTTSMPSMKAPSTPLSVTELHMNGDNTPSAASNRARSLSQHTSRSVSPSVAPSNQPPDYPPTQQESWMCPMCTYFNLPIRPGCEMCSGPRPQDYQIPASYQMTNEERLLVENVENIQRAVENYQELLAVDDLDLVPNPETFTCPICFDDIGQQEGILLRECLHTFCKDCLKEAVRHSDEAFLKCPFQDENYTCEAMLQEREIRALVPDEIYIKFLQRGLDQAESQAVNSYHCKTADCHGWCLYEDLVNFFVCPVCRKENCLTCKAIHEGMNCRQYQDDLRIRSSNDKAAKQTKDMLDQLVDSGEAMHCPQCEVVVLKKGGCDWIKCSICKLEICWVTKGRRWGSGGEGDISGGCGCRVRGKKCHSLCVNCH